MTQTRNEIEISDDDAKIYDKYIEQADYYDRIQQVYKIRLNSLYGALLNPHFKFYDLRLGSSTTGTGRVILKHQSATVNKLLNDDYDYNGDALVAGDSVVGESIITLEDSRTPIKTLFKEVHKTLDDGREYYIPEQDIKVLTYDETSNTSCFKKIKYVMRHKTDKKMFRVSINNKTHIDVTEDHSVIGYKNTQKKKKNESHLVPTKPQDFGSEIRSVVYLKSIPRVNIKSKNYPKELYEFMGYLIGDGYIEKRIQENPRIISLSIGKQDIEEIGEKLLTPLVKMGYATSWSIRPNEHDVRIHGKKLADIINHEIYEDGIKVIKDWLFKETEENISSFVRGYFTANGTVIGNVIRLTSINETFLESIKVLLFMCSISSSYFSENTENEYLGKKTGTFSKHLVVKSKIHFLNNIGFILDRKMNKLQEIGRVARQENYVEKLGIQISNVKCSPIEYDDYVYDIEVEDTHTFFANDILVHNTDSSYFKTYTEDKEKAVLIADEVGRQVNETYSEFMKETFLLSDEYCNKIKCARENVFSKSIFITKKMYLGHIVNSEGEDCSKIKMMGIALKRTTLPKEISESLKNFIERFLSSKNTWDEIKKEIVEYKEFLMQNTDDKNILLLGKPMGVKNVEDYTAKYEMDDTTNLPGHVAASICYNNLREENKDVESPKIISGTKIRIFYLTQNIKRFKSIALPTDIDVIPEWFNTQIRHIIDIDRQIDLMVNKSLEPIVEAASLKVPTRKELVEDAVLEFEGLIEPKKPKKPKKKKDANPTLNTSMLDFDC